MRLVSSLIFVLLFTHNLSAQIRHNRTDLKENKLTYSQFIQSYSDSLFLYKQQLDSIKTDSFYQSSIYKSLINKVGYGNINLPEEYLLFMPILYYHAPVRDFLRYGQGKDSVDYAIKKDIDHALMNIYLNRPDLVMGSETKLENAGPIFNATPSTVTIVPDAVTEVGPPAEPYIAPAKIVVRKPNFWTFNGDYYLQFLQNYISRNWYQGGSSNYSMVGNVVLQANYNNKQKVKFGNKFELQLGFATNSSDSIHKFTASQNLIRYTGNIGLQATKKWYYAMQLIAYTQFVKGVNVNDRNVYSDFMSPFNLNVSVGMDYSIDWLNHKLTGSVHLAPFAFNYKYVGRVALAGANGISGNKHTAVDYGSEISLNLTWQVSDMIKWTTRLYNYTTYKRYEMEWENTIVFRFNKYISTNLYLYPRFDDGITRVSGQSYWQFKEYASVGFSYSM